MLKKLSDTCFVPVKNLFLNSHFFTFLFCIYLLALIPRLAVVLLLGEAPLNLDEIEYDRIAWNLSSGLGYTWFFDLPTTFRPPGYPTFLAIIYTLFGPDYTIGRIVGAFVAALAAPLTAILGAQTLGQNAGRIASLILALYIPLILYVNALMSENLFIVLLLLTMVLCVATLHSRSLLKPALAGLVFGMATLTTSAFAAFLVFLIIFTVFRASHHPGLYKRMGVLTTVALLVVVPWAVHNYKVTDRVMFLDSRLGINLHIGFSEEANGRFHNPNELLREHLRDQAKVLMPDERLSTFRHYMNEDRYSYKQRQRVAAPIPESVREQRPVVDLLLNDKGRAWAMEYILENPLDSVLLSFAKFSGFWSLESRLYTFAYTNNILGEMSAPVLLLFFIIVLAPFPILVLMAAADLCASQRFNSERLFLLLPVVYFTAIHSVIFGDARFHFVIVPVLALFASHCLLDRHRVYQQLRQLPVTAEQGLRLRRAAFAIICAGFVVVWIWGQVQVADRWSMVFAPEAHRAYLPF